MTDQIKTLTIDGTKVGRRYRIIVDGQTRLLTTWAFIFLVKLAWACQQYKNGCCSIDELGYHSRFGSYQVIYLLKDQSGLDDRIKNDGTGRYWLTGVDPGGIMFNYDVLKLFPHHEIRELFGGEA